MVATVTAARCQVDDDVSEQRQLFLTSDGTEAYEVSVNDDRP